MTTDDELLALAEKAFASFFTKDYVGHNAALNEMRKACHPIDIKRLIRRSKRLEEAEDIVQELRDIQNGCPLPTWQEQFDAINARADAFLAESGT